MKRKRHSSTLSRSLSLFFYHHLQEAKRAVAGIWFAPLTSLMTIAVIGISLALPATLYLVLKNAQTVSDQWQKGTQITLYLHKGTPEASALPAGPARPSRLRGDAIRNVPAGEVRPRPERRR